VNSAPASGSRARGAGHYVAAGPTRPDKVCDAQERQALCVGERTGLLPRERDTVVPDEFGDDADAGHARHGHQAGRGLGMPGPPEHAAGPGAQRNTCPGRRRSAARFPGLASARTVAARSAAEMPVPTLR
jgi:hypothetical protein